MLFIAYLVSLQTCHAELLDDGDFDSELDCEVEEELMDFVATCEGQNSLALEVNNDSDPCQELSQPAARASQRTRHMATPVLVNTRCTSAHNLKFFCQCFTCRQNISPTRPVVRSPAVPSPCASLAPSPTHSARGGANKAGPGRPPCPHRTVKNKHVSPSSSTTTSICTDKCLSKLKFCDECGTWQHYK